MYVSFALIVCVSALVQAAIGFGFTPITMAFLPNMMDYNKSIAVSLAIIFLSTLIISFRYRKFVQWKILLPLMIPTFIMNGLAAVVSTNISSGKMYIYLGFMLAGVALFFFVFSERIHFKPTVVSGVILGIVCGVFYGFFAIGGPTASLYLTAAIDDKDEYMGTMQMLLCINNGLGVIIRIINGSIVMSDVPLISLGWVFMIVGTGMGLMLFKKFSKETFRKIIYAFVGLNGIWIIISNLILA